MQPMLGAGALSGFMKMSAEGSFYLITLIFLVFSLSIAYHWFFYGTNKANTMIALAIYLCVSAVLFIAGVTALNTL